MIIAAAIGPRLSLNPANRPLMQIPDDIRKCVVFVAYEKPAINGFDKHICGTGFIVGVQVDELTDRWVTILITARHVVDKGEKAGTGKMFLRINGKLGGYQWVEVPGESWVRHPDIAADIVLAPLGINANLDIRFFAKERIVTEEIMQRHAIGIGDDIFVVGLFKMHPGSERNIPIVRSGNIAAMPEERVQSKEIGLIDAYLVESRSIGGLSGSPVFVYLGPPRRIGNTLLMDSGPEFFMLGMIHGHWNWPTADIEQDATFADEKLNVGISIVIPSQKILEVLELPEVVHYLSIVRQHVLASRPAAEAD